MTVRELTPFEKNHLTKFGFNPDDISRFGEKPVEYITGYAKFLDQYFVVNQSVLIPRVETEELVEYIVDMYKNKQKVSFLEVGSGSGAIGISIFNRLSSFGIEVACTLSDVSTEALEIVNENISSLVEKGNQQRIKVVYSSLLSKIDDLSFDFCVANLPYIPSERLNNLPAAVKDFEPILALDGGKDGLDLIKRLVEELESKNFSGDLFLELDDTHDKQAMSVFGNKVKRVWKDSFDKNRFALLSF